MSPSSWVWCLRTRFELGLLGRVELVHLADSRLLLLVVTINQGLVKSLVIEVGSSVSREDVVSFGRLLNERLGGLSMAEIRQTARQTAAVTSRAQSPTAARCGG